MRPLMSKTNFVTLQYSSQLLLMVPERKCFLYAKRVERALRNLPKRLELLFCSVIAFPNA